MVVGMFGSNNDNVKDFSFVKEELKNLADIPREFDPDLYRKLGVSETVINYWNDTGYKPPYYYMFWMQQKNRHKLLFDEYRDICDGLVDNICKENQKIGEAVREFCNNERKAYEWFIKSRREYVYALSYSYSDDSGSNLAMTVDYGEVEECIRKKTEEGDKDITFNAVRYPVIFSDDGEFRGIDLDGLCGEFNYDSHGRIQEISNFSDFGYNPMCEFDLICPYIFIPHPFTKGDIVSFDNGKDIEYGVISHHYGEAEAREFESRVPECDGSDFQIVVETVYEYEGHYSFGHSHVCPIYLEKWDQEIKYENHDFFSVLGEARDILTGKSGSLSSLLYYMKH